MIEEILRGLATDMPHLSPEVLHALFRAADVVTSAREVISVANEGLGVALPPRFTRTLDDLERWLED